MDTQERMIATMRSAFAALGRTGGQWIDQDGVGAIVMASVPNRSIVNGVIYEAGADVEAAYGWLEQAYASAGVEAWTVWVPESDTHVAQLLKARGHKLDADPSMMVLDLATLPGQPAVEDVVRASPEELAAVNESAYPWHDGSLRRATGAVDPQQFHLYGLDRSSVLGIHDCDGDAGVFFVATAPEARGQGLAGRLMGHALGEARTRGCDISTLQATNRGEPVYERLGYRRFGAIQMWERRDT